MGTGGACKRACVRSHRTFVVHDLSMIDGKASVVNIQGRTGPEARRTSSRVCQGCQMIPSAKINAWGLNTARSLLKIYGNPNRVK